MKLVALMPFWRRHALAALCMAQWRALRDELTREGWPHQLELLAIGSEGDASRVIAEAAGFAYVEAPNELGDKCNRGLAAARSAFDPDAIVRADSDTLFPADLVGGYPRATEENENVGFHDMYYLRAADLAFGYTPGTPQEIVGAGQVLRRDLLARFEWAPFPAALPSPQHLDAGLRQRIGPGRALSLRDERLLLVDVKSGVNLFSWDDLRPAPCLARLDRVFPEALLGRLEAELPALAVATMRPLLGPPFPPRPTRRGAAKPARSRPQSQLTARRRRR